MPLQCIAVFLYSALTRKSAGSGQVSPICCICMSFCSVSALYCSISTFHSYPEKNRKRAGVSNRLHMYAVLECLCIALFYFSISHLPGNVFKAGRCRTELMVVVI